MCKAWDDHKKRGIQEGRYLEIYSLVHDGIIEPELGAKRLNMTTNFIMGLSFITEGAIPFAASDPLHVLPACVVGSAVAGGLSMAFGCTLMAPHGGIFVVPTIGNPLMYLVALVIGSFIACGLLGLLKKKVSE